MTNRWEPRQDYAKGLTAGFKDILAVVDTLDQAMETLNTINGFISDYTQIISTVSDVQLPDPYKETIKFLQTSLKNAIKDYFGQGIYALPVFPMKLSTPTEDSLDLINGGFQKFKQRVVESFNDYNDGSRPVYSNTSFITGLVFAVDTGNGIEEISKFIDTCNFLCKMFNVGNIEFNIPIAKLANLTVTTINNDVFLKWDVAVTDKTFPPTYYEITRKGTDNSTHQSYNASFKTTDMFFYDKIDVTAKTVTVEYTVTPVFNGVYNPYGALVKTIVMQHINVVENVNRNLFPNRCSHLKWTVNNDKTTTISCGIKNKAFDNSNNTNAKLCLDGSIVCDQLTNARCSYNQINSCSSTGFTKNRFKTYSGKSSKLVSIPNKELFNFTYCTNGKNSTVCDGYTAEKVKQTGTPPDWLKLTFLQFLPSEIGGVISFLSGLIDGFSSIEINATDSLITFTNILTDSVTQIQNVLSDIRNALLQLYDFVNFSPAGLYLLNIPPQAGGTDGFIQSFKQALDAPQSPSSGYTGGIVFLYGSGVEEDCAAMHAAWNQFFNFQ